MSNRNGTDAAAAAVGFGRLASDFANALKVWDNDPSEGNRQRLEKLRVRIDGELAGNSMPVSEVDSDKMAAELGDEKRRADTLQAMAEEIKKRLNASRPLPEPVTDWHKIEASDREWLVQDWMPAGRIGMLSGTGGAGKSLLALQLAAALASGEREWLGRPGAGNPLLPLANEYARPVVYAGYEDEPEEIRRRLGWIEARAGGDGRLLDALSDRLAYVPMAARGPVWAVPSGVTRHGRAEITSAGERLREYCEGRDACLLIVDPLASAYGSDENDNAAAAEFIAHWGGWSADAGCSVLLVHHLAKAEAASGEGEGYRGATAWQGGMRYLWRLRSGTLEALKMSYAELPKSVYLERSKATNWSWKANTDQNPPPPTGTDQCQGTTRQGKQCQKKASTGGYCEQHQRQAPASANGESNGLTSEEIQRGGF